MQASAHPAPRTQPRLAQLVRQQFVQGWGAGLPALGQAIGDFLDTQRSQVGTQREMQVWRDAWQQFQEREGVWVRGVVHAASAKALAAPDTAQAVQQEGNAFELLSDEVVDNRIVSARMALAVTDKVGAVYDPLLLRLQAVQGFTLPASDFLQPPSLCLLLVEQWNEAGLSQDDLALVMEPLQRALAGLLQELYQKGNDFLAGQGILAQQELRLRVNASPASLRSSGQAPLAAELPSGSDHRFAGTAAEGMTPLARARHHAQGVMGQLRRLLAPLGVLQGMDGGAGTGGAAETGVRSTGAGSVASSNPGALHASASPALVRALAAHQVQAEAYYSTAETVVEDYSPAAVGRVVEAVRARAVQFKREASTDGEKAIIEVVALMFQSILSEERIPSAVRVWFARLQVPVLRVALAEPEFFSTLTHPARQLIDRMGSVVLGFDSTTLGTSALQSEIRRVVQVIEQYPETGRRVFQLVHDEFEKFLAKFLTEKQLTARLVSVAQQVEQKETLVIQYTIELRTLLKNMPVRDEVREFLFKIWAEVLALSAVREGAQHPDTVAFKRAAADLIWAASAKPHRSERARVIEALPSLLQQLRQGMALVGVEGAQQEAQVKRLTDLLAEAFLSKTDASIPYEHIEAMARRLDNLEDVMEDTGLGDFTLDAEHIEMGLGIDASALHVVADHGARVQESALRWARELPLGQWFTLDHNGARSQVQYVWHSQRKQLHLFATTDGTTYLVQLGRLGAYLHTGLLLAQDEEGLTMRATRDALAKLDANPERLLG